MQCSSPKIHGFSLGVFSLLTESPHQFTQPASACLQTIILFPKMTSDDIRKCQVRKFQDLYFFEENEYDTGRFHSIAYHQFSFFSFFWEIHVGMSVIVHQQLASVLIHNNDTQHQAYHFFIKNTYRGTIKPPLPVAQKIQ